MSEIAIYRGNDHIIDLTFDDGATPPVAIDITGYTVFFTVKRKGDIRKDDDAAVITKDVIAHSDPVNGVTAIPLTDVDTDLEPDTYIYGVKAKNPSGDLFTVKVGDFKVSDDPTKRS